MAYKKAEQDSATASPKKRGPKPKPADEQLSQLTIRLSPKLKYGLELLARAQHRSLSQAIEWSLQVGLHSYEVDVEAGSIGNVLDKAWEGSTTEFDRLRIVYERAPTLLTFDEMVACELVERSIEMSRIVDIDKPGITIDFNNDDEDVVGKMDEIEAYRTELENITAQFCGKFWTAIKELALNLANAGKPTRGVSLLSALNLFPMYAGADPYKLMNEITNQLDGSPTLAEWNALIRHAYDNEEAERKKRMDAMTKRVVAKERKKAASKASK